MTAQTPENLLYDGRKHLMCSEPLSSYFTLAGTRRGFEATCSALWRGYVGTWEIRDERLYLIELRGTLSGGVDATLATLFPEFPNRVFAHWFSGTIRVPVGEMLAYVHAGYRSTYEQDHFIAINSGVVVGTTIVHNGSADDSSVPDGARSVP